MKRRFLFARSARFQRVRVDILPTRQRSARCRTLHARCMRFQKRTLGGGVRFLLLLFLLICFVHRTSAITLERVLQTTLENNPSIQEAKAGLAQAARQRLVSRSVAWHRPDV